MLAVVVCSHLSFIQATSFQKVLLVVKGFIALGSEFSEIWTTISPLTLMGDAHIQPSGLATDLLKIKEGATDFKYL